MKMKYFQIAKRMAKFSNHPDHQMGACVAYKARPLGFGFNSTKTHSKSNTKYRTIHAELSAILNCHRQDLAGSDIYIYRETKNGTLGISKPCKDCYKLIKSLGIKNIYYTGDGSYKEENL